MPSLRARLTNLMLRLTAKKLWRPDITIESLRRHTAGIDARMARRAFSAPLEEVSCGGVPALWVGAPELAARKGVLLYLHGGAWCVHLPGVYRRFAAALSELTGMRVLLVDYRLAPEHCFPAAGDDCFAVYRQLVEQLAPGIPLVVAGDSAGGNLTLVTLMRARDAGLPMPCCAVTLSPATDLTLSGPSVRYNAEADPMFGSGAGDFLPQLYCPGQSRMHPAISPLFGEWSGLPPLYFIAGSTEMLLDDSVRAHDRAVQAGVQASIDVWPEMPHVFPMFDWLPEARSARTCIGAFVERHATACVARNDGEAQQAALEQALPVSTAVDATTASHIAL